MFGKHDKPVPRNGHKLMVGIVARISGCQNQKEMSIDDQIDHGKEVIDYIYKGPVDFHVIAATKGKGEALDRPELERIEAALRSKKYDILVSEDIGRIIRGYDAVRLCGIARDCGTRVLAPNDGIDTAEESWEQDVGEACSNHVSHNSHTSKRIKFKKMNRFVRYGAVESRPIFGYIVPDGSETYDDWKLDPAATAIYDAWFTLLETTLNGSLVADWLNEQGIPPRVWSKKRGNKKWDTRMVLRVTRNTLLKGMPGRGFKATVKHNETGRRVSRTNPDGARFREYPHLAHIAPERFDRLIAKLKEANSGKGRKLGDPNHPLMGRMKKRTRFPGQHLRCGICSKLFYWGGHGKNSCLMCSGVRDYRCWSAGTINGQVAAERILGATLDAIETLPGFDDEFLERVRLKAEAKAIKNTSELQAAMAELARCNGELRNMVDAVKAGNMKDLLAEDIEASNVQKLELEARIARLTKERDYELVLPSLEDLKERARVLLAEISQQVPTFNATMKAILPDLAVYPYRLCDGGAIVYRAKSRVDLGAVVNGAILEDGLRDLLCTEICVDLFDPPQRVGHRGQIVEARKQIVERQKTCRTDEAIVQALGLSEHAAKRALALDHQMLELGIDDPYLPLTEPPQENTKFKRHLHPRYQFEPPGDKAA